MKNTNVIYKNDIISIVNEDGRISMFDSDGVYIDYFFYEDCYDEFEIPNMINNIVEMVKDKSEKEICKYIDFEFSPLKVEPECTAEDIAELREQWGDEWVCRVGGTAIILRE